MSAGPSDPEAAAFAAIVAQLGDPQRHRFRRTVLAVGSVFLALAVAALLLVLRWPWTAVMSFAVTFVVGLASGLLVVGRRMMR
ncbi:MAG: hypothetical protein ABR540_10585 [Acidimicrobiales bacterium]